jgi:hypothetical protein
VRKFLSVLVALAVALSLFAGVGAHPAKAAVTLTVTPSGKFVGGVDGTVPVDAVGTVARIIDSAHAVVDVTRASAGTFGEAPDISILRVTSATSTDPDWARPGDQRITFAGRYTFVPGESITVEAAAKNGAGTIISCNTPTTLAQVHVTTGAVGAIGPAVRETVGITSSTDPGWRIAGSHTITFTTTAGLNVLDVLEVSMVQAVPAVPAVSFLTLGGIATAGNVARVTWQDTIGAPHTASYTSVTGDSLATVTAGLKDAINAVTDGGVIATNASASAIMLTQTTVGSRGNGRTLTTGTRAIAAILTVRSLGGLTSPILVEKGKTVQLVAVDPTGAIVAATWTSSLPTVATINAGGLVTGTGNSGVSLITPSYGMYIGSFVVIAIPPQTITRLAARLVPARLKVAGQQQFGAIGASTAFGELDYTTRAVWTDTLRIAAISSVAPMQGRLTYIAAETGGVSARAAGITTTVTVKINTAGAVMIVKVPVVRKKVIVLTVGSDIVTVNGHAASIGTALEIVGGRTFVPMRFIAETFGSTVTWLPETRGITVVLGTTTIGLQIGNATAVNNSNVIALEAAPYIKNSRTMIPLRVISESFGSNVAWDPALRTITITYLLP